MKLSEISKEELELMGYDDIALIILQESGKKMKLPDIFKKVCKALELPDSVVEDRLVDFFELMSINKKFTLLKNGYWDLQTRHKAELIIEDSDDEEDVAEIDEEVEEDDELDENEDDIFFEKDDDTDDVVEDELADLMIVENDEDNI